MAAQPDPHIDGLAKLAYAHGQDPIDYAIGYVENLIGTHLMVLGCRMEDPAAFPGYIIEPTLAAVSRRIVGTLMDAGWSPPDLGEAKDTGTEPAA